MVIQHNISSILTSRQLGISKSGAAKAAEKLSSGFKINRAADDAAGLSISEKMRTQIRGLSQAADNIQDGISFCQVADGALNEVSSILGRLKELSVQAANDTYTEIDREAINQEIQELKKEINRISTDTEFNTFSIFTKPYNITVSGEPNDIKIFNDSYDPLTGEVTYGGIIFDGERVKWEDINPGMYDTAAGTFKEGTYSYKDTGLKLICKEGAEPPQLLMEYSLTANTNGISINGMSVPWNQVFDEEDKIIGSTIPIEGIFHFEYGDATFSFTVIPQASSINAVIKGLNDKNPQFSRRYLSDYNGFGYSEAVDVEDTGSRVKVTEAMAAALTSGMSLDFELGADTDGIWVADNSGNEVSGSKKTWAELGIQESGWSSSKVIIGDTPFTYEFNQDGYDIKFEFHLLAETSKDSVIQGINDARVMRTGQTRNNDAYATVAIGGGVLSGTVTSKSNRFNIEGQAELGRNFDVEEDEFFNKTLDYDSAANRFVLQVDDKDGVLWAEYSADSGASADSLKNAADKYIDYVIERKKEAILSGTSINLDKSLADIVGAGNITQSGYFSEVVEITAGMKRTAGESGWSPLVDGYQYPGATIDFSEIGTSVTLDELVGMGFNSTCKTCSNHYSIMFVNGGGTASTVNGYKYNTSQSGDDWYLEVDISSFKDEGITTGSEFAEALIEVLDESAFDSHYTQYAADGARLIIADNRSQNTGTTDAVFEPWVHEFANTEVYINLRDSDSGRYINLSYTYSFDSVADEITITMEEDLNGEYVSNGSGYEIYEPANFPDPDLQPIRYRMEVTDHTSDPAFWEGYHDTMMAEIAGATNIQFKSTDYEYANYEANEEPNQAVVSYFDFRIEDAQGFYIQAGALAGDAIELKWDEMNAYSLGLGKAKALTREEANNTIDMVDRAVDTLSRLRSTFGAYQNRLEHAFNVDLNTKENLQAAESKIRDTDMAEEMVSYSRHNILIQAGQSVLAQANSSANSILTILQ